MYAAVRVGRPNAQIQTSGLPRLPEDVSGRVAHSPGPQAQVGRRSVVDATRTAFRWEHRTFELVVCDTGQSEPVGTHQVICSLASARHSRLPIPARVSHLPGGSSAR